MEISKIKLVDIEPADYNPRTITDEAKKKLRNSIETFGLVEPIIINTKNKRIVSGHQRYQILLDILMEEDNLAEREFDYLVKDDYGYIFDFQQLQIKNEDYEKALNIVLNNTNLMGDYNYEKLSNLLEELEFNGFDLEFTGFDDFEVDSLNFGNDFDYDLEGIYEPPMNDVEEEELYFSEDKIKKDIIDNFKKIETLEQFVEMFIDLPLAEWEFNRLCQGYKSGYNISLLFNPHRLDTPTKKSVSFYQFFNDKKNHKEIARAMVNFNRKVTLFNQYPKQILFGVGGCQIAQEFHPAIARDIYKQYCNEGDKILNPCGGWGGRLIGLASCKFNNIEYWETEPSTKTYLGLLKIKDWLNLGENYKTFNEPFEKLDTPKNYFDFVFTSPPYFDTELYSNEPTQSYYNKTDYDDWKNNFYYVLIEKILHSLNDEGIAILNIGNVRYPLENDLCDLLKQKGIPYEKVLFNKIGGSGIGKRSGETGEPFIKFYKN